VRIYRTIAKTFTFLRIPFLQSQKTVISFKSSALLEVSPGGKGICKINGRIEYSTGQFACQSFQAANFWFL